MGNVEGFLEHNKDNMTISPEQDGADDQAIDPPLPETQDQRSSEAALETSKETQETESEPPQKKRKIDPAIMPFTNPSQVPDPNSKNQQKKAKRKQEWEDMRDARKAKRKEKLQAKKVRDRERRQNEAEASGSPAGASDALGTAQAAKAQQRVHSVTVPVTIIIDCQFDDYMTDSERTSLGSQLTRCYADNRKAKYRVHLAASSFGGLLKDRFEGILRGVYKNWVGVRFRGEDWIAVSSEAKEWMHDSQRGGKMVGALSEPTELSKSPENDTETQAEEAAIPNKDQPTATTSEENPTHPGEVVYLTSDSPNTLSRLSPHSTYVIGGIVDKNRHKGICYKLATEAAVANPAAGIKTAKLPIGEYLAMESRKVLTTNHVNEIMLKWLELGDWGEAFMAVIPKRKGGELKAKTEAETHDEGDEEQATHPEAGEQGLDAGNGQ